MKKAFKLLITYILLTILGLITGTLLYSFYIEILNHVTGTKFNFLQRETVLRAFFYTASCLSFFICPALAIYKIKHSGGFSQFIGYLIAVLITFGAILPFSVKAGVKYEFDYRSTSTKTNLSGGYFRESGDNIYYFTDEFRTAPLTREDTVAVVIDTTQDGKTEVTSIPDTSDFELYTNALPYRDTLVKESFNENSIPVLMNMRSIISRAVISGHKGWSFWLAFLSLGLALACIYGLSNVSDWKLVNACIVALATIFILTLNTVYFMSWFDVLRMRSLDSARFFMFLGKYIDDPLLVMCNIVLSIIFSLVGIIRFAKLKKQGK